MSPDTGTAVDPEPADPTVASSSPAAAPGPSGIQGTPPSDSPPSGTPPPGTPHPDGPPPTGGGPAAVGLPSADGTGPPGGGAAPGTAGRPPPRRGRALAIGTVIAIGLAIFLFFGLGTGANRTTSGSSSDPGAIVPIGSQAPRFTLPSLTGGTPVDLYALGARIHHPVVLNFFASWCGPCQKETPLLAKTADAERARGSRVQFIGVDVADQPSDAIPFVHRTGITYPVANDADLRVTSGLYGLNGEPNTFFIGADGRVVGHVIGAVTPPELQSWLRQLGS